MSLTAAFVLLGAGLAVHCERHSLTYTYTALSRAVPLPGIHEFTAMGQLDNTVIDYFDSATREKVPRQSWMKERLESLYWEKGTKSRQSKQQWFRVNIGILMRRMRQNDSDVHVLQWRHGCEADADAAGGGSLTFHRGVDMYSYDGNDFLSFDHANAAWVAPMDAALLTKRKWDRVRVLKEYTMGYLEKDCTQWLGRFLNYSQERRRAVPPPDVYVFVRKSKVETNVILSCLATGFYAKDVTLSIKRDGRVLTRLDGVRSSDVRPNEDDTYQRKDQVEVLKSDESEYRCEAVHAASGLYVEKVWDHRLPADGGPGVVVGALLWLLLAVALVSVVLVVTKKGRICKSTSVDVTSVTTAPQEKGSEESLVSKDSGISTTDENRPNIIREAQGLLEGRGQDGPEQC